MKRRAALAAMASGLLGCGYALVGRGTTIDPTIKRIGVPLFKDTTGKAGLDQKITQSVVDELLKRGRFDVVSDRTGVDALVDGEVIGYEARPIGFSEDGTSTEGSTQASRYAVTVRARVRFSKTGQDEPIWQSDNFSFRDEYDIGANPAEFFDREEQALERLSESFGRSLVAGMLEAF